MSRVSDPDALMRELERSLWAGEHPESLRASFVALAHACLPGTPPWQFALGHLAALLGPDDPWKASVVARRLLAHAPRDHVAWAVLGLSQSLLGHSRYAIRCYERAVSIAPDDSRYAHNLGHLYDVALDQPERALPLLRLAHEREPRSADIAASFAHALGRAGRPQEGLAVLEPVVRRGATRDQAEVHAWLAELVRKPTVPPTVPPNDPAPYDDALDERPARRKKRRGSAPR
ncbi:MAG TPA: tetratricopeptide repeat protein [Polyangiaceae bacterium]|nr:tetratricopeptide repeat protein [Polyangiaceae bacterium]